MTSVNMITIRIGFIKNECSKCHTSHHDFSIFKIIVDKRLISLMKVGRDAAHLYDAVMLYAWSIRKILQEDLGDPNNGTLVIDILKRRPYFRYLILITLFLLQD